MLVIEERCPPPTDLSAHEDWVRPPVSKIDIDARVALLRNRLKGRLRPMLDPAGVLTYQGSSVVLSTTQCEIAELLVAKFDRIVYRSEFFSLLAGPSVAPTRNSIDLQVMRLRRRVDEINLSIRTVWSRGYVLECA